MATLLLNLPSELAEEMTERAARQGATIETLAIDALQRDFAPFLPPQNGESPATGRTLYDRMVGKIGRLHSSEFVPGGAQMSTDSDRKITEILLRERRKGRT